MHNVCLVGIYTNYHIINTMPETQIDKMVHVLYKLLKTLSVYFVLSSVRD